MRLQALHCPSCGAPVALSPSAKVAECAFCRAQLRVHPERVCAHLPPPAPRPADETPRLAEPDPELFTLATERFELSCLEQRVPGALEDIFQSLELPAGRFAFVSLRAVEPKSETAVPAPLGIALGALRASLEEDGDPGLSANRALEALCAEGFGAGLEVAVLLFDPRRMVVTPYLAARRSGAMWLSGEEGRAIALDGHREPLQRKHLREAGDTFANGQQVLLAAEDLMVLPSAGMLGTGAVAHGWWETARSHLGEAPLRIVTLLKNAYWTELQSRRDSLRGPPSSVRIVAVRAQLPALAESLPAGGTVAVLSTPAFELAALLSPTDSLCLHPLHGARHVAILFSSPSKALSEAQLKAATAAVLEVLDRPDHGDNENPRLAGRSALETLPEGVDLCLVQLLDAHGRVKYFRRCLAQPVALGPRGVRRADLMPYDEGGEATVAPDARLFFPGTLPLEGPCSDGASLAAVWPGGKASRLYQGLVDHWKTKTCDRALQTLSLAALSDVSSAPPRGLLLVTGKKRE